MVLKVINFFSWVGTYDKNFTHISPREVAYKFLEEAIVSDNENLISQVISEKTMVVDNESWTTEVISQKAMLIVIFYLNGLHLMHSQKPSQMFPSIGVSHNTHTILHPWCLSILKILLENINVGIWSTATKEDIVFRMVRGLQKEARQALPFYHLGATRLHYW